MSGPRRPPPPAPHKRRDAAIARVGLVLMGCGAVGATGFVYREVQAGRGHEQHLSSMGLWVSNLEQLGLVAVGFLAFTGMMLVVLREELSWWLLRRTLTRQQKETEVGLPGKPS